MNDGDFQKFCYEEYKRSHSSVEDVYRRYPFAVTVVVVLTTAACGIGSNDHWSRFFVSVDATLYYVSLLGALLALSVATMCIVLSALPKDYEDLGAMRDFAKWRDEYRAELRAIGTYTEDEIETAVERHCCKAVTERLAEAVDWNTSSARARLRLYNRSIYSVSVAVVCLALAAGSLWIINVRSSHAQPPTSPISPPAAK